MVLNHLRLNDRTFSPIVELHTPHMIDIIDVVLHSDRDHWMSSFVSVREPLIRCNLDVDCCNVYLRAIKADVTRIVFSDELVDVVGSAINTKVIDTLKLLDVVTSITHSIKALRQYISTGQSLPTSFLFNRDVECGHEANLLSDSLTSFKATK